MLTADVIIAEHARLSAEIARHKTEMMRHRRRLRAASAARDALAQMCRDRNIQLPPRVHAEGKDLHGHTDSESE